MSNRLFFRQSVLFLSEGSLLAVIPVRPASVDELVTRAQKLSGRTLEELATAAGVPTPTSLNRSKGWVGQLLEWHLGASAGSKPEQDFPELGVELKTLPITADGKPVESTFVCIAPLTGIAGMQWAASNVCNKLSCVLWVPVEASPTIPLAKRRIATPFLWSPSNEQAKLLRQDWEELMEMIALGEIESVTAHHGEVLQLRPKAANGSALTPAIGRNGQIIQTRPRGFYLRSHFTHSLLKAFFGI